MYSRMTTFPQSMPFNVYHYWRELKPNLIDILKNPVTADVEFPEAYMLAYRIVLSRYGDKLYYDVKNLIESHLIEVVLPTLNDNPLLLSKLIQLWNNFNLSMTKICDITMYLHKTYIEPENLLTIKNRGSKIFQEKIILSPDLNNRIKNAIFEMIELGRKGECVEWEQLAPIFKIFFELGSSDRKFYEDQFETIFLQKVAKFYQFTSEKYLNNADEYIRNIYEFVNVEEKYADKLLDKFLDPKTHSKWKNVIIHELITTPIQKVIENEDTGLVFMLNNGCFGNLNLVYCLLKRVPELNVAPVVNKIEDHVIQYIRNCWRNDFVKINEFLCSQNFNGYVQSLFELEQKMNSFIKKYFKVQSQLTAKVQVEILHLLNVDPQLLSLYIDHYLKKGLKNESETDRFIILERALNIFKYISDKDIFEKYYKQHLTKRLIFDKSSSNEAEKFVISKLKYENGIDFTQKIEAVLKDIEISKTLTKSFKDINDDENIIDFSVKVLTKSFWPISDIPACILPFSAETAFTKFKEFYLSKHSGRELTINPYFGFADLKATFYKKDTDETVREETKILTVTTFQMCILMKFNESESFTLEEIMKATKIPEIHLKRALALMSMGKESQNILRRNGNGFEIENGDVFSVNDEFTSKLNRIKIQTVPSKFETKNKTEEKEIHSMIEKDRNHEIEAAIIRIMKSRQNLIHNELITEVTKLLQSRFLPDPIIIKKRIGALIEREYLKRDENVLNLYHYIS